MAKKQKIKKTQVEQILDKAKIDYQTIVFNISETGTRPVESEERIFKTLALTGDKTGPIIGILSINDHLSEKKFAQISGNKKVQMIPQKDLQATTGYVHGANNPVGIRHHHRFPIFIDQTALELGTIVVSAGELGRSIKIDSQTLANFVQAKFADLKEDLN